MKQLRICLVVIAALLQQTAQAQQQKKHYNVLVLLTDDQRFSTIHALGNEEIITPNMDRLVRSGTTFTQAHIMGSLGGAVCAPSRAMLLSSRHVFQVHQDGGVIPGADTTFPELFRQAGYQTYGVGKWHSDYASFNRSFAGGDNIFFGGMHTEKEGGHLTPKLNHYDSAGRYKAPFKGTQFSSVMYADAAAKYLESPHQEPFLMYVAFTAPHDPRTPPAEFLAMYDTARISLPANFYPQHPFDNGEMNVRDEMLLSHPRNPGEVKQEIAKYYAMITEVDHEIGKVLQSLEKSGQLENTIIVLAGDNGLAVGQHGLLGKQNLYDHSMRVPLIWSGPGIPANKQVSAYCYLNDVYPTLCELNGLRAPAGISGISLAKGFTSNSFKGRRELFTTYSNLQRAITMDSMKLVMYNVNGAHPIQLFDLHKDPLEMNNLAGNKAYAAKVKTMTAALYKAMKGYGDFCDPAKPGWGYPEKLTWAEALKINP
ncbi:sulfatase-like hydrolase/transferase [Chitinophaga sp. sic0106]|uniref:sulfatase-like hydrolase/transferase n=1 Tax=Chitinophaga sp. sic0106 TaxID=2854785 RepID=UPI001C44D4FD|nr:sulfatase-like hydrolase/transferase [Chitinophaga sp. sic0106]MBV7530269.1 sulfatase-like hydrolase/transferase [Chitinophaga sp. sic0106]